MRARSSYGIRLCAMPKPAWPWNVWAFCRTALVCLYLPDHLLRLSNANSFAFFAILAVKSFLAAECAKGRPNGARVSPELADSSRAERGKQVPRYASKHPRPER